MRQSETFRNSAFLENHDPDDSGEYIEGRVFVGMAFDVPSDISDTYRAIQRACRVVGLEARRVDDMAGSGPIPARILREIEAAEFLIFDLTEGRPNVYYELGYAHGVGNRPIDILLIARSGSRLQFNVSQLSVLFYDSATDLENRLPAALEEMIVQTRTPSN